MGGLPTKNIERGGKVLKMGAGVRDPSNQDAESITHEKGLFGTMLVPKTRKMIG